MYCTVIMKDNVSDVVNILHCNFYNRHNHTRLYSLLFKLL